MLLGPPATPAITRLTPGVHWPRKPSPPIYPGFCDAIRARRHLPKWGWADDTLDGNDRAKWSPWHGLLKGPKVRRKTHSTGTLTAKCECFGASSPRGRRSRCINLPAARRPSRPPSKVPRAAQGHVTPFQEGMLRICCGVAPVSTSEVRCPLRLCAPRPRGSWDATVTAWASKGSPDEPAFEDIVVVSSREEVIFLDIVYSEAA